MFDSPLDRSRLDLGTGRAANMREHDLHLARNDRVDARVRVTLSVDEVQLLESQRNHVVQHNCQDLAVPVMEYLDLLQHLESLAVEAAHVFRENVLEHASLDFHRDHPAERDTKSGPVRAVEHSYLAEHHAFAEHGENFAWKLRPPKLTVRDELFVVEPGDELLAHSHLPREHEHNLLGLLEDLENRLEAAEDLDLCA